MNAITHIWRASMGLDWVNQTTQNPYMGGFSSSSKLLIMRFVMPIGHFSHTPSHNISLANTQVQCQDGIADDWQLIILFIAHPADYIHSICGTCWLTQIITLHTCARGKVIGFIISHDTHITTLLMIIVCVCVWHCSCLQPCAASFYYDIATGRPPAMPSEACDDGVKFPIGSGIHPPFCYVCAYLS